MEIIIEDAFAHGWVWARKTGYVIPPITYACASWPFDALSASYQGVEVTIPMWIFDESVRHTGSYHQ